MILPENKLFEEIIKATESKSISEVRIKGIIKRQSSWTG